MERPERKYGRCRNDGECSRDKCPFQHPKGKKFIPCPDQEKCKNLKRCMLSHYHYIPCQKDCKEPDCRYMHSTDCLFDGICSKDNCEKRHRIGTVFEACRRNKCIDKSCRYSHADRRRQQKAIKISQRVQKGLKREQGRKDEREEYEQQEGLKVQRLEALQGREYQERHSQHRDQPYQRHKDQQRHRKYRDQERYRHKQNLQRYRKQREQQQQRHRKQDQQRHMKRRDQEEYRHKKHREDDEEGSNRQKALGRKQKERMEYLERQEQRERAKQERIKQKERRVEEARKVRQDKFQERKKKVVEMRNDYKNMEDDRPFKIEVREKEPPNRKFEEERNERRNYKRGEEHHQHHHHKKQNIKHSKRCLELKNSKGKEEQRKRLDIDSLDDEQKLVMSRLQCIVCMDREKSCMLLPCKHMMYCGECAELALKQKKCFFCNSQASEMEKIFF